MNATSHQDTAINPVLYNSAANETVDVHHHNAGGRQQKKGRGGHYMSVPGRQQREWSIKRFGEHDCGRHLGITHTAGQREHTCMQCQPPHDTYCRRQHQHCVGIHQCQPSSPVRHIQTWPRSLPTYVSSPSAGSSRLPREGPPWWLHGASLPPPHKQLLGSSAGTMGARPARPSHSAQTPCST